MTRTKSNVGETLIKDATAKEDETLDGDERERDKGANLSKKGRKPAERPRSCTTAPGYKYQK